MLKPYLLRARNPGELPEDTRLVHAAVRLTPAIPPGGPGDARGARPES